MKELAMLTVAGHNPRTEAWRRPSAFPKKGNPADAPHHQPVPPQQRNADQFRTDPCRVMFEYRGLPFHPFLPHVPDVAPHAPDPGDQYRERAAEFPGVLILLPVF